MSEVEFSLPELGDGIEAGTIVKLLVAEGDVIAAEQSVMEVEIDKATIELPCPHAGRITRLAVSEGDQVAVGAALLSIDASSNGAGSAPASGSAPALEEPAAPAAAAVQPAEPPAQPEVEPKTSASSGAQGMPGDSLPAGPAVRRLARLLGVELASVQGSGERGRIRAQDVHAHLEQLKQSSGGRALPSLPDFSRWGPIEERPLSGVRKKTAAAMQLAWEQVPQVTQHDVADITELEGGRKAYRRAHPDAPKVTMTALVAKATAVALKQFPDINSSIDLARGVQILKTSIHLGIAVDTEYGLLVPVLRDADQRSVVELAEELNDLARRTRERKILPAELQGGTFTISNLGGIGGTAFSPIVNWPQVGILGVCRGRREYQVTPEGPRPRLMMPLCFSYDHRLVDGATAARFTRHLAELLSNPALLMLEL